MLLKEMQNYMPPAQIFGKPSLRNESGNTNKILLVVFCFFKDNSYNFLKLFVKEYICFPAGLLGNKNKAINNAQNSIVLQLYTSVVG